MSMVEYNTLNYIMYKEAMARIEAQEAEEQAARDDEVKKQLNYGSGSQSISVLSEKEKQQMSKKGQNVKLGITESDLEQLLEEEGLL